jgi:hypothetical protein
MVTEQQEHDHQEQHEQGQEAAEAPPPEEQEDVEDERQEDLPHGGGGELPLPWDVDVAASDIAAAASAAAASEGRRRRQLAQSSSSSSSNNIPVYMTDESLMNEILELSKSESTFRSPFRTFDGDIDVTRRHDPPTTTGGRGKEEDKDFDGITSSSSFTFVWNDVQVQLTRRLLDIDPNLLTMFTKLCKGTL